MNTLQSTLRRLRRFNRELGQQDTELDEEAQDARSDEASEPVTEGMTPLGPAIELESIVLRRHRPVLRVIGDTTELAFRDGEDSAIWRDRLGKASAHLDTAIRAVGRINLSDGPYAWVGTGWLVRENIIVTNRHVAETFTDTAGAELTFVQNTAAEELPQIDFLKEFDSERTRAFRLLEPLYLAPRGAPDIAFFRVEQVRGDASLSKPINLTGAPGPSTDVATIGYPAFDSRIPEVDLMEEIYGRQYNRKRLAPGAVTQADEVRLWHNCTTLGGNSGSAIIDLETGKAVGLHFSGTFLRTNYAVRSDVVGRTLEEVLAGTRSSHQVAAVPEADPVPTLAVGQGPNPAPPPMPGQVATAVAAKGTVSTGIATVTVPLTITLSLGETVGTARFSAPATPAIILPSDDAEEEARPEDYADRGGYATHFISERDGFECPLPVVQRNNADVLEFEFLGETTNELKYQHFSVVMNRPRRLCFFSAVNIDGSRAQSVSRTGWKWDPRIARDRQIKGECYGSPPLFSRGHMTRRNDPSWGPQAARGNTDSMHVTNATPQMQAFNSPIWLELEDYALANAVDDGMRVSVFTGPVFGDDPEYYGVRVPVAFWKVIIFRHDRTQALTATGYRMDQSGSLPSREDEEFVFGDFTSSHTGLAAQVPIRSIEAECGLSFGPLAALDPFDSEEERLLTTPVPLLDPGQIRFYR